MKDMFGGPPKWFDVERRGIWRELLAEAPPGLWMPIDRWGLEVIAVLVSRCRSEHAMRGDFAQLQSMLNRFGLTPRSRARIASANARMAGRRNRLN